MFYQLLREKLKSPDELADLSISPFSLIGVASCFEAVLLITYTYIDSQWEFAVCLRKLKQGLFMNLEGWDGEGDGREVEKGGDICIPMDDSC